jgi:hypothetical protein
VSVGLSLAEAAGTGGGRMKTAAILALALVVCACGSFSSVPIKTGEVCAMCGQSITDVRFAAEAISPQGVVSKFRTTECLAKHVRRQPENVAAKFVTDFNTGRMIRPESATYVRTTINENTGEKAYVAFSSVKDAVELSKKTMESPIDWLRIQRMSADTKSN